MIVDTRPVRRIGKMANQVKFGKQPNGTLFPMAMSPTNVAPGVILEGEDYGLKVSINNAGHRRRSVFRRVLGNVPSGGHGFHGTLRDCPSGRR
jgi:hypothetical protein